MSMYLYPYTGLSFLHGSNPNPPDFGTRTHSPSPSLSGSHFVSFGHTHAILCLSYVEPSGHFGGPTV
jgi:hypothetical protein